MCVELDIYRARLGMHYYRHFSVKGLGKLNMIDLLVFLGFLLYQSGDIEKNPGPQSGSTEETSASFVFPPLHGNFSLLHYNVQSLYNKLIFYNPNCRVLISFLSQKRG